jgi:hypothetical protein
MKIYTIINIARQINGPLYFVMVEKAFKEASDAQNYLKNLKASPIETRVTPNGESIQCEIDRGVSEIELED